MTLFKDMPDGTELHFATLKDHDGLPHLALANREHNDFLSDDEEQDPQVNSSRTVTILKVTADLAHVRLGYPSNEVMQHLNVTSLQVISVCTGSCDSCKQGKFKKVLNLMHRALHSSQGARSTRSIAHRG
jgi:hypothetical protein